MNIFGNVERRAQHAFQQLCKQFGCEPSGQAMLQASDCLPGIDRQLSYYVRRQFFSRIYKLDLRYEIADSEAPEGRANWTNRRSWKSAQPALASWLSQRHGLAEQLSKLDTEQVSLSSEQGRLSLHVRMLPGCFIWTLLPPMHYFVRMKETEVALISGLPELLQPSLTSQAA
jgi:hypothetical protein